MEIPAAVQLYLVMLNQVVVVAVLVVQALLQRCNRVPKVVRVQ
jgi:hypothetical protein